MYDETRNRNSSKLDKSSGRSFRRRAQSSRISCGLEQAYKREGKQKSYYVVLWTVIPTPACTQDKLPFCCDDLCYTITAKGEIGQWQSMHVEWDLLWGQNKGSNLKEEKKNNLGSKHGTIAFPRIHWQYIWCPHWDLKKWIFSKSAVCYGQTVQHTEFSTHHTSLAFFLHSDCTAGCYCPPYFFYKFGNRGTKKDANLLKCHIRITMEEALENQRHLFLTLQ